MGYIMDLRKELPNPHRPLIMCSAGIIIIDKKGRVLLQKKELTIINGDFLEEA